MDYKEGSVPRSKVFVVENDAATRKSLAWLLASAGFTPETFETAEGFLATCGPEQPGCLVLDVRLPGMSGVVLQEELERLDIRLPVIIVTGFADVHTAVRVLKRGAFDFMEKPLAADVLIEGVRQAIAWDAESRRARAVRDGLVARLACLTARERAVFDQVVRGKPNKVVAIEFGISEKTVEAHRARVMHKLGAGSLAELVRMDLTASQGEVAPWMRMPVTAAAAFTAARHASA